MRTLSPEALRVAIAGMLAMAAAMGIGRFVYTPILPGMSEALGHSTTQAGLIAAANYAGYLAGALAAGGAWGHARERTVALASLAASGVLCLAMAASDLFAGFLAIRFAAGLASAFVMVFLSGIVLSELAARGRPDMQWLHFGGVGVGIALSALLVAGSGAAGFGWRGDWVGAAFLSFAALAAVATLLGGGRATPSTAEREPPLRFTRSLALITAAYGVFGFGYIVTATFLVAIVRTGAGSEGLETLVWLVTGLVVIPSLIVGGRLAARFGIVNVFAAGCLVEAIGVAASVALDAPWGPLLGGALLGGTFVAITALGLQAGRKLAGAASRKAFAAMTAAFGTGQILGPAVAGFVADWTGGFFWPSMMAAAALVVAAGLARASRDAATVA